MKSLGRSEDILNLILYIVYKHAFYTLNPLKKTVELWVTYLGGSGSAVVFPELLYS